MCCSYFKICYNKTKIKEFKAKILNNDVINDF